LDDQFIHLTQIPITSNMLYTLTYLFPLVQSVNTRDF